MTRDVAALDPLLHLAPGSRPRVAVVTGSYGAGHDAAARELARVLTAAGCDLEIHDVVALLPWRLGPVLRAAYYAQVRHRPGSWGTTLRLVEPGRRLHRRVAALLALAADRVVAATRGCDLVVTTHPFGAQALGCARASGRLGVPVVTYLTDASVHSLWVHPGVDLNLAIHEVAAQEARGWGGRTVVVRPLVPPHLGHRPGSEVADPLADHEVIGPRALVTGGSLGMGDLERTARDVLAAGGMTPVVLCGTDARLRRRLARLPGVVALGWREDVAALMATSACIVQNAGGFTSLEGLASGTPVITYLPLPGHGAASSANLERAGLVPWARTRDDLALLLAAAAVSVRADRLPAGAPEVVTVLTGARIGGTVAVA
ncbi:MGDG synthase family glycosyltransferase [Nocardioides sp.]|uniref:MGDG synthase family glycosyltransferase n=1 Tax=Nocardioides sp. TaxID=35761 RepID=UPI002EDA737B